MEGVNSFEKGLHRSNSPQEQPEGSYVDALNWVRNDSGRLVNEELEELVGRSFTDNRILLGHCVVNNKTICFFKIDGFSEIGVFENKEYKPNFNDSFKPYKLNFNKSIDCLARVNNADKIIVYFVEENQKPRRYTLDTADISDDERDFDLQLEYKLAQTSQEITRGGSLKSGVYSIVIRYRTSINNFTFCNIPSRFVTITDDDLYNDSFDGCPPGTSTNKGINIKLTRTDLNFPFIEPIIITYEGITNVLICRSLGIYSNAQDLVIPFVSDLQYKDSVPLEEITASPILYSSATCIEQKDNILILSNLKSKTYDRNIQKIANKISVIQVYEELDDIAFRDGLNFDFENVVTTESYNNTGLYKTKGIFEDPTAPSQNKYIQKKSFKKGEVYSLSITPIYSDGSIGFSYHIPAKDPNTQGYAGRTTVYTSQENYPEYLQSDGLTGGIRHHKISEAPRNTKVFLKLIDIDFSSVTGVQGYIIGYQQRNIDLNTSHITTGIAKPYIQNGNYKRNSLLSSTTIKYTGGAEMRTDFWGEAVMFYSPDIERGLELNTGYKIRLNGYIKNEIKLANNSIEKRTAILCAGDGNIPDPILSLFFEDPGNTPLIGNRSVSEEIEVIINVPRNKGSNIRVDSIYDITETSGYTHIKTKSNTTGGIFSVDGPQFMRDGLNPVVYVDYDDPDKIYFNTSILTTPQGTVGGPFPHGFVVSYVDIFQTNTIQYGKLENAEYAPLEVVYDLNKTEVIIEGDIYTQKYWFHIHDAVRDNFKGGSNPRYESQDTDKIFKGILIAGVWLESKSNYNLRHSDVGGMPYYPKNKVLNNNEGTGVVNLIRANSAISTGYNKQYSVQNNTRLTFPKPLLFEEVIKYTNRSVYSEQIFESELVDQWRVFKANSFHDIPKNRGIITDTFVFNNNFFHHTEYGLWLSYFNPNTTQTTSQGEVVLGNAGIFRIPSKLILDIKGGYMGTMDKSGTNTPFGRIFLDHNQGKIFLFAGDSPVEISDLGLFSFFREFVNTNDKYSMGYDWANKRLLISNITQEKAISFYPKTQTWTSLHDFAPKAYLTINGFSFAYNNNSFWNLNNSQDIRKNSYITFVENTQPDGFKRFDRIEMNTMSGGIQGISKPGSIIEPNDYVFLDKSFTHIHAWTDRQNTTELPFAYSQNFEDNFLSNYKVDEVPVNYYRSSFHAELPLDAVVDPYKNIFDTNNTDINADFRAHMKGKFLYTKLSYNEDKPLVLNYIKTFFKPSVA